MAKKQTSSGSPKPRRKGPRKKARASAPPVREPELEEEAPAEERAAAEPFLEEMEREATPLPPSEDTLAIYLREIGQYPILTREQEHKLAVRAK
ncbi:MAG: hypothetical protein HYU38_00825, partial [Candidatus Tectomicrobia bacterium]|nr:hypothetical protein [Candidatus Tectomicrobia bacterium]